MSQSRLNVCDNYKSQVSEPAKTVRLYKEQQLKKVSWSFLFLKQYLCSVAAASFQCACSELTSCCSAC